MLGPESSFRSNKNFKLVWVSCLIAVAVISMFGISTYNASIENEENIPMFITFFNIFLFLALLFLFDDMKISLTTSHLKVKFGIGVFKKKFVLKEIELDSINIDKPSKWYGIGWRYKLNGDLILNTKYGKSVCFSVKKSTKTYHIVTSNYDQLRHKLFEAVSKANL